jgi:hypothetical protein
MYGLAQAQSVGRPAVSSEQAARHNVAAYEAMLGTQLPASAVEALLENFVTMNTGD